MLVAWQAWRLEVPEAWAPVRLEGDADAGYLLLADMKSPRLGVRWSRLGRKGRADASAQRAMPQEVGQLAAAESIPFTLPGWTASHLYEEKEPPGRDVWVGFSQASGRLFQLAYHTDKRDRTLAQQLLPTLKDAATDGALDWSVYELSCHTPAGLRLKQQRLNAGDLGLMFSGNKGQAATVRQIALARMALKRRPLEKWVQEQASWHGRHYRLCGAEPDGSGLAMQARIARRRRFALMWWLPQEYVALAMVDESRDRLIIVDATSEALAHELLKTVGWYQREMVS